MKLKTLALTQFIIWMLVFVGWVLNIVQFCRCDFDAPYKAEIIRGAGVVIAPVGSVVGYLNIQDEKKE